MSDWSGVVDEQQPTNVNDGSCFLSRTINYRNYGWKRNVWAWKKNERREKIGKLVVVVYRKKPCFIILDGQL